MIHRIVLIKLKDEYANQEGRAEVVARSREVLPGLPGVRDAWAGGPADERSERDWDVCLRIAFDSIDDVPGYIDDPDHRVYVDDFLRPRLEVVKAWNFGG